MTVLVAWDFGAKFVVVMQVDVEMFAKFVFQMECYIENVIVKILDCWLVKCY